MINPIKVFGAGLSSWGQFFVSNWKRIVIGIAIIPFAAALLAALLHFMAIGFLKFALWLSNIPGLNDFILKHSAGIVYSILGGMILVGIILNLYQDGKERLAKQNDKISGV